MPLHVSAASHTPAAPRHVVPLGRTASVAGQKALAPVHISAWSHTSVAARQVVVSGSKHHLQLPAWQTAVPHSRPGQSASTEHGISGPSAMHASAACATPTVAAGALSPELSKQPDKTHADATFANNANVHSMSRPTDDRPGTTLIPITRRRVCEPLDRSPRLRRRPAV